MIVEIKSRTEATTMLLSKNKQYTAVVSISGFSNPSSYSYYNEPAGPCTGFYSFSGPKLFLEFEDELEAERGGPVEDDIRKIIAFYDSLSEKQKEGPILFHCLAGISRSSAAAIIMSYLHLQDINTVIEAVYDSHPFIWPNYRMIELADNLLNLESKLINANKAKKDSLS